MEWNERKGKETEGGGRERILEKICYAMRLKCEATMILSEAEFDHRRKVHRPREGGRNERRNTNNKRDRTPGADASRNVRRHCGADREL